MPRKAILVGERGDGRKIFLMLPRATLKLPSADDESFRCVGFIDEYGHTVFNRLQMPTLMAEIRHLEAETSDEGARQYLRGLHELAEECCDGVHLYLKLMGD